MKTQKFAPAIHNQRPVAQAPSRTEASTAGRATTAAASAAPSTAADLQKAADFVQAQLERMQVSSRPGGAEDEARAFGAMGQGLFAESSSTHPADTNASSSDLAAHLIGHGILDRASKLEYRAAPTQTTPSSPEVRALLDPSRPSSIDFVMGDASWTPTRGGQVQAEHPADTHASSLDLAAHLIGHGILDQAPKLEYRAAPEHTAPLLPELRALFAQPLPSKSSFAMGDESWTPTNGQ